MLGDIFRFLFGFFRRRSQRNNINRELDNIEDQNDDRKNVVQYKTAPIESFVPNSFENIVVSGVNNDFRNHINAKMAWQCHVQHRGAVILHCSNIGLQNTIASTFSGENGFYSINSSNSIYNPFIDLDRSEIAQLILNTSGNDYKIERIGSSYLYGLIDYLNLIHRSVCVDSLCNCIRDRSYEFIMDQAENGEISEVLARRINTEFAQGQTEQGNIEQYFNVLHQQGDSIFSYEDTSNSISIKKALRQNEIVMIDIGDASNSLLLNVIIQEIKDSISRGCRFSLIVDSIPVDVAENLGQLLRTFSGLCNFSFSSQDVYADTQGMNNVFETLIGRAGSVYVMRHNSPISSRKFSEFFGQYQKVEVNRTITNSDNYMSYGQILPGSSTASVYGQQLQTKPRVEESEISSQRDNHVFVKRSVSNEVASVQCTLGNAKDDYEQPEVSHNRTVRSHRRSGINWFVFILLLIVFFPAAFIYSFFKSGRRGKIISVIFFILLLAFFIIEVLVASGTIR